MSDKGENERGVPKEEEKPAEEQIAEGEAKEEDPPGFNPDMQQTFQEEQIEIHEDMPKGETNQLSDLEDTRKRMKNLPTDCWCVIVSFLKQPEFDSLMLCLKGLWSHIRTHYPRCTSHIPFTLDRPSVVVKRENQFSHVSYLKVLLTSRPDGEDYQKLCDLLENVFKNTIILEANISRISQPRKLWWDRTFGPDELHDTQLPKTTFFDVNSNRIEKLILTGSEVLHFEVKNCHFPSVHELIVRISHDDYCNDLNDDYIFPFKIDWKGFPEMKKLDIRILDDKNSVIDQPTVSHFLQSRKDCLEDVKAHPIINIEGESLREVVLRGMHFVHVKVQFGEDVQDAVLKAIDCGWGAVDILNENEGQKITELFFWYAVLGPILLRSHEEMRNLKKCVLRPVNSCFIKKKIPVSDEDWENMIDDDSSDEEYDSDIDDKEEDFEGVIYGLKSRNKELNEKVLNREYTIRSMNNEMERLNSIIREQEEEMEEIKSNFSKLKMKKEAEQENCCFSELVLTEDKMEALFKKIEVFPNLQEIVSEKKMWFPNRSSVVVARINEKDFALNLYREGDYGVDEQAFKKECCILQELREEERIVNICGRGSLVDGITGKKMKCLVLELCEERLTVLLEREGQTMSVKERVQIASDVVEGLVCLQKIGVVHRDVRPRNVLMTRQKRAKISGLGRAKMFDEKRTRNWEISFYTSPFAPPEALRGQTEKFSTKYDVYSVGMVIICLLFGECKPYDETFEKLYSEAILKGRRPKYHYHHEHIPVNVKESLLFDRLLRMCERCWQTEPKYRLSMLDLKTELGEMMIMLMNRKGN